MTRFPAAGMIPPKASVHGTDVEEKGFVLPSVCQASRRRLPVPVFVSLFRESRTWGTRERTFRRTLNPPALHSWDGRLSLHFLPTFRCIISYELLLYIFQLIQFLLFDDMYFLIVTWPDARDPAGDLIFKCLGYDVPDARETITVCFGARVLIQAFIFITFMQWHTGIQ